MCIRDRGAAEASAGILDLRAAARADLSDSVRRFLGKREYRLEQCVRSRQVCGQEHQLLCNLNPHRALLAALRARTVFDEPVSYTHLRAHETVLDLVCRLLLEKKKK